MVQLTRELPSSPQNSSIPFEQDKKDGVKREVMAYTMNAPYKDQPAIPSDLYFMGIVEGCHQNGISSRSVTDALKRTRQEVGKKKASHKKTEVSR